MCPLQTLCVIFLDRQFLGSGPNRGWKSPNFKIKIFSIRISDSDSLRECKIFTDSKYFKWKCNNGPFLVNFLSDAHLLTKFHVFHDFDNVNINFLKI